MRIFFIITCLCFPISWISCETPISTFSLLNLRCEYLQDPEGIDVSHPRLSWEIQSKERGVMQTAYQILVASSEELLENDSVDFWNSGKIFSDSSVGISYAGIPLEPGSDYYWKVKVWTNKGAETESEPAHWSMGLLTPDSWEAKWTGLDSSFAWEDPHANHTRLSARYFRKEFEVNNTMESAKIYISGLGTYQLFINGNKIGDAELSPDPTQYNKRVFYNTYDVTDALRD